jgi:hypothetical protein
MRPSVTRRAGANAAVAKPGGAFVMDRSYDDIASRAYDLFLSRGGQHGRDIDDWLEAERQLTSNGTPPRPTRRLASTPRATNRTKRQKTR